ncbi:MAG: helix-turn-helix domain-containing protein [Planctomycetaceae bacterium]|nr:helix-turn-helix domain-containing protein [Planctomycetaceae bacterium]
MQSILLNTKDAAALCGVTIKRWRTWNTLGKIPAPLRIGKNFFWKHAELVRWVEADCPARKHWNTESGKKSGKGLPNPQKTGKLSNPAGKTS